MVRHPQNPFDAFTSRVTAAGVPVAVAAYAALLASGWAALPASRYEFINEALHAGLTVVGGVTAPHALTSLFGLFR